ncbi:hypothetical protein KUT72_01610 [Pseudomonas aeruginosa]|uniref:LysM peptidoglycan-binding domain-containing protein n=1 Tax=Pseudomonas aeruginosa TaxID=287 RepID=UPI001C3CEDED|nr:hypothetical protein [Pseudomonas aeruginosa]MBV5481471.1 hypothetical protein [Pseudomonas aeruginosa]MBV5492772.1 hypothetical protein [Pseudomonas aeruginosa]MBV5661833.1 hypothetical protein [Pseudomonas aeruginosa]MCQ9856907.1 hypothetical protein [Pseudomonas aeruginosa]MCS8514316.1 hypothetical protein [Pseudomonas aeruginosa]
MQQNENFAKQPEQAEAERPEVVAYFDRNYPSTGDAFIWSNYEGSPYEPVMTVSQHERIVEARWNRAMDLMGEHVARISEKLKVERDVALARRVAELELGIARIAGDFLPDNSGQAELALDEMRQALHELLAAAPTQAQHSVPAYVSYTTRPAESLAGIALRQLKDESRWVEIRDINAHTFPDMQSHSYYPAGTVIKLPAAAPGKEVGHE